MNVDVQDGTGKSFQQLYNSKNNAFDIIRFILATMVIYSHSYPLFYGPTNSGDILLRVSKYQIDFGALSVICFFIISGFLITQSLYSSKGYFDYFLKRGLRIFPALIASTLFFSIIVGLLITKLDINDYFSNHNPNNVKSFVIDSITMNFTGFHSIINDVFQSNPYPSAINGSAWTLKHEFVCYIVIALMSYFYIFRHKVLLLATSLIVLMLVVLNLSINLNLLQSSWWVLIEYQYFIKFLFYFLAGSMIFVFKNKIYYNNRLVFLAIILLLLAVKIGKLQYAMLICLPYLIIAACIKIKFSAFRKHGDFSYGMYIYAFPVQQTVMYFMGVHLNFVTFFLMSSIVTLILSILSCKFIEEPALKLKNVINIKSTVQKRKINVSQ